MVKQGAVGQCIDLAVQAWSRNFNPRETTKLNTSSCGTQGLTNKDVVNAHGFANMVGVSPEQQKVWIVKNVVAAKPGLPFDVAPSIGIFREALLVVKRGAPT